MRGMVVRVSRLAPGGRAAGGRELGPGSPRSSRYPGDWWGLEADLGAGALGVPSGTRARRAAVPGRWSVSVLPGRPESPSERLASPELPSFNPKEREQCHSVVVRRPVLNLALPQLWELCRIFVGLGHSRHS